MAVFFRLIDTLQAILLKKNNCPLFQKFTKLILKFIYENQGPRIIKAIFKIMKQKQKILRRAGKNTHNYTKKIIMTQITTMV